MSITKIDYFSTNLQSPLHNMKVETKMFFLISTLLAILLSTSLEKILFVLILLMGLSRISRIPLRFLIKTAMYPTFFSLLFAISQIHHPHTALLSVMKAFSCAFSVILFSCTTPFSQTFFCLGRINKKLSMSLFFTYRFFFTFLRDLENKLGALKVRGGYAKLSRIPKNVALVLGELVLEFFERGETLFRILKIRGFRGKFHTVRRKMKVEDLLLIFFGILMFWWGIV